MEDEDVSQMDALFRGMDFVAEDAGLKERLWSRILAGIDAKEGYDRPLSDTELSLLAAASGRKAGADAAAEFLKPIGNAEPKT